MLQIFISGLFFSLLELLCRVLFDQYLFCILLLLITSNDLIPCLLPDPKASVKASRNDIVGSRGGDYRSYLENSFIKVKDKLIRVEIPELQMTILAC